MSNDITQNNISSSDSSELQSENQPEILELLETYLTTHSKTGNITFKVFQKSPLKGTLPVPNAKITLEKELGENYYISKIFTTGIDGKTETIALPTVSAALSQNPDNKEVNATYSATIEAEGFFPVYIENIPVFEYITTIQPVNMLPDFESEQYQNNMQK